MRAQIEPCIQVSREPTMKPNTTVVMRDMIQQVRDKYPFALTSEELCADTCSYGCPLKLLEYMDFELTEWEMRMENGEVPNFGDIKKLSKTSKRIYTVLEKNHLVGEPAEKPK